MPVFSDGQKISAALAWDRLIESIPASYVIWKDGDTYRAECLLKGGTDYSGTDATVIQSALNSLTPGRTWKEKVLLKGTFEISGFLNIPAYTILQGGKITGNGRIYISNSHVSIIDVEATVGDIQAAFEIYAANETIEDIEFINCRAINCGGIGFFNDGEGEIKKIKNVRYINCKAINCGRYSRYNDWIVGFDLAENVDLEDCLVVNCLAEGSWESGFHFESSPIKKNVMLIGCISKDNGKDKPSPTYGAGYVISSGVSLIGCISIENHVGFRIRNNKEDTIQISGCKDYRSDIGLSILDGDVGKVLINDLVLFESQNKAVSVLNAGNCFADKLTIINPVGDGTLCTSFGTVDYPIHDCIFEIFAFGGQSPYVIYTAGSSDLYFSGSINTTQPYPFRNIGGTNIKAIFKHGSYITVNSGTATISAGSTSVTVNHGLAGTPTIVTVTPSEDIGDVWVDSVTSTSFTIHCEAAPSSDVIVYWYAEYKP